MKCLICFVFILSSAFAGEKAMTLVESTDHALGAKIWKVSKVPKAKEHRTYLRADWELVPYVEQCASGSTLLFMKVTITGADSTVAGTRFKATMPDAVTLRTDDTEITIKNLRHYHDFGLTHAEFVVRDISLIQKLANSKDAWMIGFTESGAPERREVQVPDSWKEALSIVLAQYQKLTMSVDHRN